MQDSTVSPEIHRKHKGHARQCTFTVDSQKT